MYDVYVKYNEIIKAHKEEWSQNLHLYTFFVSGYDEEKESFYFISGKNDGRGKMKYFFDNEDDLLLQMKKMRMEAKKYAIKSHKKCIHVLEKVLPIQYKKRANVMYVKDFRISMRIENFNDIYHSNHYLIELSDRLGMQWIDYNCEKELEKGIIGRFLKQAFEHTYQNYLNNEEGPISGLFSDITTIDMESETKKVEISFHFMDRRKYVCVEGKDFLDILTNTEKIAIDLAKKERLSRLFK